MAKHIATRNFWSHGKAVQIGEEFTPKTKEEKLALISKGKIHEDGTDEAKAAKAVKAERDKAAKAQKK